MTKYVVSGYIGFDNFGDEAICGVLTNLLRESGAEKITVISANPEKTTRLYGVKSCGMFDFVKDIFQTDVLISSGGSLLQDVTSLKSLMYYLAVIMTAIILNKRVFIFAQGFTPFRTKIGGFLTKHVLKNCDRITVRDSVSLGFLENMGIKSEQVSDPVFALKLPKVKFHNGVGVQLRACNGLNEEFLTSLADEISKRFLGVEIKLFSLQDGVDLPVIDAFAGMLGARGVLVKIYKNMSVQEVLSEISALEYFIGMRFHSNLIAARAGVKVLGINYDLKVKTLAEEIGFPYINMYGCETGKGFDGLFAINPADYKLPEIKIPDVIV